MFFYFSNRQCALCAWIVWKIWSSCAVTVRAKCAATACPSARFAAKPSTSAYCFIKTRPKCSGASLRFTQSWCLTRNNKVRQTMEEAIFWWENLWDCFRVYHFCTLCVSYKWWELKSKTSFVHLKNLPCFSYFAENGEERKKCLRLLFKFSKEEINNYFFIQVYNLSWIWTLVQFKLIFDNSIGI